MYFNFEICIRSVVAGTVTLEVQDVREKEVSTYSDTNSCIP